MIWLCRECEFDVEKMIREIPHDPMRVCEKCGVLKVCYAYEGEMPESIPKPPFINNTFVEVASVKTGEVLEVKIEAETVEAVVADDKNAVAIAGLDPKGEDLSNGSVDAIGTNEDMNATKSIDEQIAELQAKKAALEK